MPNRDAADSIDCVRGMDNKRKLGASFMDGFS